MHELISKILKESAEDIDDFFKPKNLKSREEKYLKELEKKRKECVNEWGEEEVERLTNLYFSFYDQLPEPYKTQAKNNFDIAEALTMRDPKNISAALSKGFYWRETPEGDSYWRQFQTITHE